MHGAPKITAEGDLAAGYLTLEWELQRWTGRDAPFYDVEVSGPGESWSPLYSGSQTSKFVSGLANGEYRFRVRADRGPWSPAVVRTIKHHPRSLALTGFGLGGLVFGALVIVLVRARGRGDA